MNSPKLYTGTAGWSYDDWHPNFYPFKQSKDFNWLEFYSRYFNAVEVNSTYYTYISPKVVENWLEHIDDNKEFLFTLKLHMDFTHKHNYDRAKIKAVKFNLDLLQKNERLGGLLMQFPYSFDCNDGNIDYLRRLIGEFEEYDKFVEVRHRSWQNKKAKTVTFCTIDQPGIGEAIEFNPVVGNGSAYIRFHGRNAGAWKDSITNFGKKQSYAERSARYDYLYSPGELAEINMNIKEVFDKAKRIFIIMNNHPQGKAVANAFELLHYLKDGAKIKMPDTIVNAYPHLREFRAGDKFYSGVSN